MSLSAFQPSADASIGVAIALPPFMGAANAGDTPVKISAVEAATAEILVTMVMSVIPVLAQTSRKESCS